MDDSDKMQTELSWLYKSWILNNLDKEFDLVVYYNPSGEKRLADFEGIKPIAMQPIRSADKYMFLNSHYFCLPPWDSFIVDYEYLIKTDCDVFLTHNLKGYNPGDRFHYGLAGYYGYDEAHELVSWIANFLLKDPRMKLSSGSPCKHRFMTNVGASFFGKSDWVINTTAQQALLTEKLLEVFSESNLVDAKSLQRVLGPGLCMGISSMIAGELVVNTTMGSMHVQPWSLDSKCWETTELSSNVIHIHAWHSTQKFSKHAFFRGEYEDWKVHYDNRLDNCANYCQWIATTPLEEIKQIAKKNA